MTIEEKEELQSYIERRVHIYSLYNFLQKNMIDIKEDERQYIKQGMVFLVPAVLAGIGTVAFPSNLGKVLSAIALAGINIGAIIKSGNDWEKSIMEANNRRFEELIQQKERKNQNVTPLFKNEDLNDRQDGEQRELFKQPISTQLKNGKPNLRLLKSRKDENLSRYFEARSQELEIKKSPQLTLLKNLVCEKIDGTDSIGELADLFYGFAYAFGDVLDINLPPIDITREELILFLTTLHNKFSLKERQCSFKEFAENYYEYILLSCFTTNSFSDNSRISLTTFCDGLYSMVPPSMNPQYSSSYALPLTLKEAKNLGGDIINKAYPNNIIRHNFKKKK